MLWFILILAMILAWAVYGLHVLELNKPVFAAFCKPAWSWLTETGNLVRILLWIGAAFLSVASWLSPSDTLFNQMLPDFISISIAVIVIDELVGYRNRLERKQEIIEQIESPVRDIAVEAMRLVRKYGWLEEVVKKDKLQFVHLEGANLRFANLAHANLREAHLERAKLRGANLTNANLFDANLESASLTEANLKAACLRETYMSFAKLKDANLCGANLIGANLRKADVENASFALAIYSSDTIWPEGFDPKAAGAIEVEWNEEQQRWTHVDEG